MDILGVDATNLFVGSEAEPRQVVRVRLRGTTEEPSTARLRITGERLGTEADVTVGPLASGEQARLDVGVRVEAGTTRDERLAADVVLEGDGSLIHYPFELAVAEPGWRMFMVSHFHYDPVWWNTQAAYTEAWGAAIQYRQPFQEPGLALVKAHLEMARREPDYKFVLAELDYLKPYWDVYPEDRAYIRELVDAGRLELMGGTYNEPNTNLTSAESTIRNAIYGIGYQRDVLGGAPATAWQLDAFGHDPQFPGIMADAGVSSSSWARGPFHEWGPHWMRGPARMPIAAMAAGGPPRMQFSTEFDWVAPSGRALLTSFMADHYSAGWWMDSAATLEEAEAEVHRLFTELAALAATKNVLLPVGTDYTPPNRWLTAIQRDWNARYVWPKFIAAIPREFFDAVRAERAREGREFTPQTRDMNPIYTGKDVSFIDTKQAQRLAENTLLSAEKFATVAMLLGARYPDEAIDKAWRQLLFGAHHDGITGSESDQVYLDLLGGWREAYELGASVLDASLERIGGAIDTTGDGQPIVVFNPLSWPRTDLVRVQVDLPADASGLEIVDDEGAEMPFVLEAAEPAADGRTARATLAFVARDVPAVGYATFHARPGDADIAEKGWRQVAGDFIENDAYSVKADAARGGAISSLIHRPTGKQLIRGGEVGNELRAYREYPNHPLFGEGPWHLTPDGRYTSSAQVPADLLVEESPIGRRIVVEGPFDQCRRRQEVVLWDGIDRVEFTTTIDDYTGQDRLFRVRFPASVRGGRPIFEIANAVIGRPFGTPNVDVAKVPFTLDNPAYNWFGLGSTARVELLDGAHDGDGQTARAGRFGSRSLAVGEIVVPDDPGLDEPVRRLVVALVQQGITSTVSSAGGDRYGVLHIDSNLPDFRLVLGAPANNEFVDEALSEAGTAYGQEIERQLTGQGWARLWIPARTADRDVVEAFTDLRAALALPILVVAGIDGDQLVRAIDSLIDDLADGVVTVAQPRELGGTDVDTEEYTIAVLNRGTPGSSVERAGDLYLSLMRSCSGWPSGVWIDPPRRSVPDGSNFQFQHWSHTFDYALMGTAGDWRVGDVVRAGHEYNNPFLGRVMESHSGTLPPATSFVEVEPPSAVVTALKPAGNPMARMAMPEAGSTARIVLRLYESAGRPTPATLRTAWSVTSAASTNATEESAGAIAVTDGKPELALQPFQIATVRLDLEPPKALIDRAPIGPRSEPAQPVYAQYWMHNKGPAPFGYQPVTVHVRPRVLGGAGPFRVRVFVASERTDDASAGTVTIVVPPGWGASPPSRIYRLAAGAHLEFESVITPPDGSAEGRYFVAARIEDAIGQMHEDVATVDYRASSTTASSGAETPSLAAAIGRAMRTAGLEEAIDAAAAKAAVWSSTDELGGELEVTMLSDRADVTAGDTSTIRVRLRNLAMSEIRGEAQLISPHETWPSIRPWTTGFVVAPGAETRLAFEVRPPHDRRPGTYWALVKVMYFGRLHYTEAIEVRIDPPATTPATGAPPTRAATPVGARRAM